MVQGAVIASDHKYSCQSSYYKFMVQGTAAWLLSRLRELPGYFIASNLLERSKLFLA